jgi:dihydromethanopterin reductase
MMDVRLIAAVGRRGQLGLGGKLPWHDPIDLRWFRATTMDGVVLMGGRTYDLTGSLPGRIKARWSGRTSPGSVLVQIASRYKGKVIWIAGGAFTYAAFMPFVRVAVVTRVDYDGEADSFMPPIWGTHDNRHRTTHNREPAPTSSDRGPGPGTLLLSSPEPPSSTAGETGTGSKPVARKRPRQPWLSPRRRRSWKRRTT